MLLNASYPADIRVKKEAKALLSAGYELHLLCLRRNDEEYYQEFEGIKISRIDAGKNNYHLAFWDMIMSLFFVHPKFLATSKKIIRQKNIDVVHVHDLPLAGTALNLKKKFGVKILVDFHENYPEALRTWFAWKKNPLVQLKNYLFMNPTRWHKLEKKASRECDSIIAVVDEMKERLIRYHQLPPQKITVVTNTEDSAFALQPVDNNVYQQFASDFIITYSGGVGPHRGVDTAIEGMSYLKGYLDIKLVIVGSGSNSVMKVLHNLVKKYGLTNVYFIGYQPFHKFYSFMHLTNVNVIPHHSNGHTDNTVPHKIFQGMMAEKPLLVSSSAPLKRLVEQTNSGLVFVAGNANDFAEKVLLLYNGKRLCEQLGKNGKKATTEGGLNWETTQQELIRLYNSFLPSI